MGKQRLGSKIFRASIMVGLDMTVVALLEMLNKRVSMGK